MDFMLYVVALNQLRSYFGFNDATAGLLATVALVMSGVGGLTFGYVADRFGRTRALMGTIALFSIASLGAASSQSVLQLMFWRALLGLGMGGEWASGAVLVSETWPPEHRNKAISIMQSGWALGYILALLAAQVDPRLRTARPGQLAIAVHPRHPAGVLRHLDSPLRAGAGEVDAGTRRRTRGAEPVPRDLRPRADRPDAADHPARRRRAVRILGCLHVAARVSRPVRRGRRCRAERRPLAGMADPGAARRLRGLPDVRIHRRPAGTTTGVRAVHDRRGGARTGLRSVCAQPDWC